MFKVFILNFHCMNFFSQISLVPSFMPAVQASVACEKMLNRCAVSEGKNYSDLGTASFESGCKGSQVS